MREGGWRGVDGCHDRRQILRRHRHLLQSFAAGFQPALQILRNGFDTQQRLLHCHQHRFNLIEQVPDISRLNRANDRAIGQHGAAGGTRPDLDDRGTVDLTLQLSARYQDMVKGNSELHITKSGVVVGQTQVEIGAGTASSPVLTAGAVGVNLTLVHYTQLNLPFGGVNGSGIGAAHGQAGFRAFSHERAVMRNRFLLLPLLFPPYTPRVMRLIRLIKRVLG